MTIDVDLLHCMGPDQSLPRIESQGHRSNSRIRVGSDGLILIVNRAQSVFSWSNKRAKGLQ